MAETCFTFNSFRVGFPVNRLAEKRKAKGNIMQNPILFISFILLRRLLLTFFTSKELAETVEVFLHDDAEALGVE